MVIGVGIDVESVRRFSSLVGQHDQDTLGIVFTRCELDHAQRADDPARYLAVCFSTKEAMSKALGTGFSTIGWLDIEVEVRGNQLFLTLLGNALVHASELGASDWKSTWCEWEDQVFVTVVLL